jgi:hypothetical protein
MAQQRDDPAPVAPCPFLGLRDDPATRYAFPSPAQQCHARRRPAGVDLAKQEADCLTVRHVACRRFRPPVAGPGSEGAHRGSARGRRRVVRRVAGILGAALLLAAAAFVGVLLGGALGLVVPR